MIYGISLLLMILGLVVALPALRKLAYMRSIRKNSQTVRGQIELTRRTIDQVRSMMGMFVAEEVFDHQKPLIRYQPQNEKEMRIEVTPSNFLSGRKYETGEAVEVAYDLSAPWRAYPIREWKAALRDLWIGAGISLVAVILWVLGRLYNLPF